MEGHAYLGEIAAALVYLIVGVRLLRLAARTGEAPERLLGVVYIFTGVSYATYNIPIVLDSEALWTPLNFAGRILFLPAPVVLAVFTRQVFRADSAWAAWLVRAFAALLVLGVTGSALRGDWEGFSPGSPWFWLEWLGYTLPYAWAGAEALIQYRQARRRMRVGLCNPLVCNRLLLWGLYGTTATIVSLAIPLQYAAYQRESVFNVTWDLLVNGGEIFTIALMWFVFFPPAAYRRWVAGAAAPAATAEG
jgi:hypothetical protein